MKKLIITAFLLSFVSNFSQEKKENISIQKGIWNVEGSVSFYTNNNDSVDQINTGVADQTNFTFYPKVGYSIKRNLIIGMGLGIGHSDYSYEGINTSSNYGRSRTEKSYSSYAFVKKIVPLKGSFAFNFQGELGYSNSKEQNNNWNISNNETTNTTTNTVFVAVRPGITYFLSKHFSIEGKFGVLKYDTSKSETKINTLKYDSNSNSFYFHLNPSSINLGLTYYF